MRILLLTDEAWNDKLHGNNVMSNWFGEFPAEFANIYYEAADPDNTVCSQYFQLTNMMLLRSLLHGERAGKKVEKVQNLNSPSDQEQQLNKINEKAGNFIRDVIREFACLFGRYNVEALQSFVRDFDPDIVLCIRGMVYKNLKIEEMVYEACHKPMIVITGDEDYSYRQLRLSPVFWFGRWMAIRKMHQNKGVYSLHYGASLEIARELKQIYGLRTSVLYKSGEFSEYWDKKTLHHPIRMVYAGRLYCNRWKTLAAIGAALKRINQNGVKMVLDIYTTEKVTTKQRMQLHDNRSIFLRGAVPQEELTGIYHQAHIALHVESFDLVNKMRTRVSFSTKIIDCLGYGCAVMAICWNRQSGWRYLRREKAAICIGSTKSIYNALSKICNKPEILQKYAENAWRCGNRHHRIEQIREQMYTDFQQLMGEDQNKRQKIKGEQ